MKFYRNYLNPKTGRIERVEARRNKDGFYVLHDLRLPSKVRKLRVNQIFVRCDLEMTRYIKSGRYAGRCVRPGVKGSIPSEFSSLQVGV
jgi:hypothetical protein